MEINGKKVLTLPQQVLQNQKDIAELQDIQRKYRHKITLLTTDDNKGYVCFDIVNYTKEAYTNISQVINAMGTKSFQAIGICDEDLGVGHIYEISYDSQSELFLLDSVVLNEDTPQMSESMELYKDYVEE